MLNKINFRNRGVFFVASQVSFLICLLSAAALNGREYYRPWFTAAENGEERTVAKMLHAGIRPDVRDVAGNTALIIAASRGHSDVVKVLLEYLADVNATNRLGTTALIDAASNGYFDVVEILLKHGANPNIQDKSGRTALTAAQERGYGDFFTRLLNEHRTTE